MNISDEAKLIIKLLIIEKTPTSLTTTPMKISARLFLVKVISFFIIVSPIITILNFIGCEFQDDSNLEQEILPLSSVDHAYSHGGGMSVLITYDEGEKLTPEPLSYWVSYYGLEKIEGGLAIDIGSSCYERDTKNQVTTITTGMGYQFRVSSTYDNSSLRNRMTKCY